MTAASSLTIVAEAAQGFEGDPTQARLLVRAAGASGADAVKFQLVYADELVTPDNEYFTLFRSLEMPVPAWQAVADEARRLGLDIIFDVFGLRSLEVALAVGASGVKLHAADFFNEALVDAALAKADAILVSIGGIRPDELDAFVRRRPAEQLAKVTLMYGFQGEPTAMVDNQLRRLATLAARFPGVTLGFMDHADGDADEADWLGILALPFGVRVVEKHITLERALKLEDYVSALAPSEFARYVRRLRAAEVALGQGALELRAPELAYRGKSIKAVVASRALAAGTVITSADVALLRGRSSGEREPVRSVAAAVGHVAVRALAAGAVLYPEDLK